MATAALFATFLLIATAASAASDTTTPTGGTLPNPCIGDTVTYQGQDHTVLNVTPDHFNLMDQITGKGAGSPSNLAYNIGMTTKVNAKFPSGPMTFRTRSKVISNGPADNFFVSSIFHVNADGSSGPTTFESDCRG